MPVPPPQPPAILVTGGAGFIGSCLVRQLVAEQSARVVNLDKLTYAGSLERLADVTHDPLYVFERCDILDRAAIRRLLDAYHPCEVYHLAAESHVDRSIEGPGEFIQTNVVGTFELLEAIRAYWQELPEYEQTNFRLLHVSTDEVYGSLGPTGRFHEESRYAPSSPYSASKAAADHLVRAYYSTYGLPAIITNGSNNYGPFQFPEKLIPLMILNAREGKPLPIYGDGSNVRDWLYVDDHCRALRLVMRKGQPGETYNIGGDCERTNLQIVESICEAVDRICPELPHRPCKSLISFVADRPGHDHRYAIDATRIRTELGWRPEQDFESGIARTVEWYLGQNESDSGAMLGAYARDRLGVISRPTG